jgi:Rad3-related DNA helicase
VIYAENREDGRFCVKLFCVNPAANLNAYLSKGISTVFFSATLLPLGYYRNLLSSEKDDYGIYIPSPFDPGKRRILIGKDVSSRYTRRNYEEYRRIAQYLAGTAWQKKGNYMVFFPSYKMLTDVLSVYEEEFSVDWVRCIVQTPSMQEGERESFLKEFEKQDGTLLAFCIMGGIFSEGIDLIGEKLIGVMIVGCGLPQIGTERDILKNYYDEKGENGFDYAYRYPGMNKVLQAAGRVIRTQEDTGIILLLDDRFALWEYRNLFPVEWADARTTSLSHLTDEVKEFWQRFPQKDQKMDT